ncbi:MAG: hypothetical protein AB7P12_03495 [Alphaproteobacteria bacterium]
MRSRDRDGREGGGLTVLGVEEHVTVAHCRPVARAPSSKKPGTPGFCFAGICAEAILDRVADRAVVPDRGHHFDANRARPRQRRVPQGGVS